MSLVNQTAQWNALEEHWGLMSAVQMRDLFEQDPARAEQLITACGRHLRRLLQEI